MTTDQKYLVAQAEAFEKWVKKNRICYGVSPAEEIEKDWEGNYKISHTAIAWSGWQAGRAVEHELRLAAEDEREVWREEAEVQRSLAESAIQLWKNYDHKDDLLA